MKKYIIVVSVVALILTQVSCVTYLVRSNREDNNFIQYCIEQGGQVVDGDCIDSSGKEQKNYEYFCIEQGGQYVGGGIFDWDGKCIMPKDNIDVKNFTPEEKYVSLGGTYLKEVLI